jgi:hypothetical protein
MPRRVEDNAALPSPAHAAMSAVSMGAEKLLFFSWSIRVIRD